MSAATLEEAIALAVQAHRGQRDKYGAPYILHPLRVMHRLGPGATEAQQMAAVLILPNALARRVKRADLEDKMEVLRMPAVTAKDAERLARYRAAWTRVTSAEQAGGA